MKTLDQAIADATATESAYRSHVDEVSQIEAAIATATQPLSAAQATVAADAAAFNAALDALSAAALAAKVS